MKVRDDKIHIEKFENILSKSLSVKIGIFYLSIDKKKEETKSSSLIFYNISNLNPFSNFLSGRVIFVLTSLKYFSKSVALAFEIIPKSRYIS